MKTVDSVVADLKSKGSEKTRITYERHGVPAGRALGVSVADLKTIAKSIKGQQALAMELHATDIFEAMYLAGIVADGAKMSREQLQMWAEGCTGLNMISEYTVPWVTVENAAARELALGWIASDEEYVASAGWRTYAGLVTTKANAELDLAELERLLERGRDANAGRQESREVQHEWLRHYRRQLRAAAGEEGCRDGASIGQGTGRYGRHGVRGYRWRRRISQKSRQWASRV